jgi:hypothetical protein
MNSHSSGAPSISGSVPKKSRAASSFGHITAGDSSSGCLPVTRFAPTSKSASTPSRSQKIFQRPRDDGGAGAGNSAAAIVSLVQISTPAAASVLKIRKEAATVAVDRRVAASARASSRAMAPLARRMGIILRRTPSHKDAAY